MRRWTMMVGLLAVALLLGAAQARAAVVDSCCACIVGIGASESLTPALFCGFFTAEQVPEADQRCDALGETS